MKRGRVLKSVPVLAKSPFCVNFPEIYDDDRVAHFRKTETDAVDPFDFFCDSKESNSILYSFYVKQGTGSISFRNGERTNERSKTETAISLFSSQSHSKSAISRDLLLVELRPPLLKTFSSTCCCCGWCLGLIPFHYLPYHNCGQRVEARDHAR
jgi:hypothetical protein